MNFPIAAVQAVHCALDKHLKYWNYLPCCAVCCVYGEDTFRRRCLDKYRRTAVGEVIVSCTPEALI